MLRLRPAVLSMETKYLLTTFRFSLKSSSLCCLDKGGAHCCHLTWAEGSRGCGWAEMGLWGPLSIGAGYFMYLNTSFGAAEEAAMLESRILYPKRKQQCLQFFYRMSGSPSDRLVVWIRRDDSTGNVRKLVKVKTFQGTWRRPAGTDWASHPGLCSSVLFALLPLPCPFHPPAHLHSSTSSQSSSPLSPPPFPWPPLLSPKCIMPGML